MSISSTGNLTNIKIGLSGTDDKKLDWLCLFDRNTVFKN